jgi:hypothetical protein
VGESSGWAVKKGLEGRERKRDPSFNYLCSPESVCRVARADLANAFTCMEYEGSPSDFLQSSRANAFRQTLASP